MHRWSLESISKQANHSILIYNHLYDIRLLEPHLSIFEFVVFDQQYDSKISIQESEEECLLVLCTAGLLKVFPQDAKRSSLNCVGQQPCLQAPTKQASHSILL